MMAAASLTAILAGCGSLEGRLTAASSEFGRQNAGMAMPALPVRCRNKMPRVTPKAGEKWRAVQRRWEIVADAADRQTADCAAFYDDLKAGLSVAQSRSSPTNASK